MPTGSEFVNAAMKRFLSQNRISNEIIEYLQENSFEALARIFPSQGLFTFPVTITPGVGSFALSVVPAGKIEGTDGLGHSIELAIARQVAIAFEDDGASTYWIGMKYIEIPNGIYDNPRTGKPEYDKFMEEVGELAFPNLITDLGGGSIQIRVNSIFESGVDHSGRTVRVWLVDPLSGDETIAFEDLTVSYAAPNNYITTNNAFGQGTVSLTTTDYKVACLGVTVRKSVANPFSSEYILIGNIDTSGPGVDNGMEVDLSGGGGHTLQRAYDGVGAGAGRTVTLDNQAIQLRQSALSPYQKDIFNAVLRLRKDTNTAIINPGDFILEGGLDSAHRLISGFSTCHRASLSDGTGADELRPEEDAALVVGTANVNFTRIGVDLTLAGGSAGIIQTPPANVIGDLCEISNSALGQNGVYIISAVNSPTQLALKRIDLTNPVFVAESVKARIFRIHSIVGFFGQTIFEGLNDFLDDLTVSPDSVVKIVLPESSSFNHETGLEVVNFDNSDLVKIHPGYIEATLVGAYGWTTEKTFYQQIDGTAGFSDWDNGGPAPYWMMVSGAAGLGANRTSTPC